MDRARTEFYISSPWRWKPKGVDHVLRKMADTMAQEGAEFTFDTESSFFKVKCLARDEDRTMNQFKIIQEEIEDEVLRSGTNEFLHPNGTINRGLDSDLIGYTPEHKVVKNVGGSHKEYTLPSTSTQFQLHDVWTGLETGNQKMAIHDLLNEERFALIERTNQVAVSYNLSGKAVYIFANAVEAIEKTFDNLDNLLAGLKIKDPVPTHIFNTESYVDNSHETFFADARYIGNITPALLTTTLLDRRLYNDPAVAYPALPRAISLRLCQFDERKQYHVSLLGPAIKTVHPPPRSTKSRVRTRLFGLGYRVRAEKGRGPNAREWIAGPGQGVNAGFPTQASQEHPALEQEEDKSAQVENWLIDISTNGGPQPADSVALDEMKAVLEKLAPSKSQTKRTAEELKSIKDFPTASSPISFGMGALVPEPTSSAMQLGPESKSPVKTALERQSGLQIPAADNTAKEAERKDSVKGTVQKKANARAAAGVHIVERPDYSSQFAPKMDDAIRQLVAKGPYLPGKITLRADFGRVLLRGIDESALNFRAEGSRSNGWPLEILSQRLRECKGTSFTKILTTDGVDVEYLVGIRDARTGQLLWNPEPTNRTIYSFACTAGQGNKNKEQFFLDIDGTEDAFTYVLRGKNEDKAPIWVHGLLRNWDFRVAMSHTNVAELENKFGPFARSLVANLQVTLASETDDPRLRWGIHDDFHVAVNHMRTLTKWRFMSRDGESHLNITEVLENDVQGCKSSPDMNGRNGWFMQMAQLYKGANRGRLERLGFPDRWYEASVTSAVAEDMLCQNESLCFAARADWDFESLKDAGALNAILKPALRMLQEMDSVGAGNDNRQAGMMKLPRPNNTFVPAPGVQVEDPNAVFW
ncbi:hypothetical protein QBC33DRAFT_457042 [Phialemonium atrogriseum]|uniref:Uncharacterized protein n=1 Tax=Phialemonium atrogriseum TaxID=1093897 RepID=A0AAJ0FER1_9PEZI|nr:uncharacterized protein QBC33DRAFT_457042 [Phialemonium atrogriseum]KAK1764637.1 hypothetical protein QBC33DRAFT_457042 [Phialemonium atrogriseum]